MGIEYDVFSKEDVNELPEEEFVPVTVKEMDRRAKEQMQDFTSLLSTLDTALDKKKQLWKLIFENAVVDRKNAYLVFADLYVAVHSKPAEHAIHGPTLSKYMERMSKATDQLLKLAELVANAEEKVAKGSDERLSEEDIYNSIKTGKNSH